jgi:hypothetical protein
MWSVAPSLGRPARYGGRTVSTDSEPNRFVVISGGRWQMPGSVEFCTRDLSLNPWTRPGGNVRIGV